MKLNKSKLLFLLIAVVSIISFSSCTSEDSYWTEGTLDYQSTINVSPYGDIKADLPIDYSWVTLRNAPRDAYFDDIKFVDGHIEISSGPYIDGFTLTLSNSDAILPVSIRNNAGGILNDSQTRRFLNAVIEVIRRNGRATIYVDGKAASRSNFNLDFYIDVDAYVRD